MNKQYARDFCTKEERHKILKDWSEQGLRIVIKTCHSHFTTYIGVSENHPLANLSYDDVGTFIKVHGGLTFGGLGDDKYLPKGFYWYGWDYANDGD